MGDTPNSASEPLPCCQKKTTAPKTAASEIRLSTTALSGSRIERKVRTSSTKVMTEMSSRTYGKLS